MNATSLYKLRDKRKIKLSLLIKRVAFEYAVSKRKAASSAIEDVSYCRHTAKAFRVVTLKQTNNNKKITKIPLTNCTYTLETAAKVGKWGGEHQFYNAQNSMASEQRKGESINL